MNRPIRRSAFLLLSLGIIYSACAGTEVKRSRAVENVLREPLAPETLHLVQNRSEFIINGPTFSYHVERRTGAIGGLEVSREGRKVISQTGLADIRIDNYRLESADNSCVVSIQSAATNQIVLLVKGNLPAGRRRSLEGNKLVEVDQNLPGVAFTIVHTFFSDGVVVSKVTLLPHSDLPVHQGIVCGLSTEGEFTHYLHKRRDENGDQAVRGKLPASGSAVRVSTLTSCLSVYSPSAALSIFTDRGATYMSNPKLESAMAEVTGKTKRGAAVNLSQYIVHVAAGANPYVLKAGEEFTFRVGISLAPNRVQHERTTDLRMFIWIGDAKYPYPTDEEITKVAHWGYTVFQLHRVGTPGEPRPPAGEFERVLRKVHELGMLFLWEENADLLYTSAPGVQEMKAKGKWNLWQGFNYDGHYVATMDPYCDLIGTCLASPNGMAEYRLANLGRMLQRYDVDGVYLDDNLAYANCPLWKEHGHPSKVYDSLIELHEMNWRRREFLRGKVPHALLISHNTHAFVLPIIADFDVQYFAEGYCFDSAADYWNNYRAWGLALNAQSMICPGDDEGGARCHASMACNYDLLTGGGEYSQMDWRLFYEKFHYAGGANFKELEYSRTYNNAQSYFGLYESQPYYFADSTNLFGATTPGTLATVYRNHVWNDWLIPIANMDSKPQTTSLNFRGSKAIGILPGQEYLLFDIHERATRTFQGSAINGAFRDIFIPGQNLQLYALRQHTPDAPCHIWGGKRLSEVWNKKKRRLTVELQGPAGLEDTVFFGGTTKGIARITVAGKPGAFAFDPIQQVAHGPVTFTAAPLKIEVEYSTRSGNALPNSPVTPDAIVDTLPPQAHGANNRNR